MELEPVYDLTDDQIEDYCDLYQSYLWWEDRTLADVRTAIENTDVVVGLADGDTGTLVAAGRVLTDSVYYGKVYDVLVLDCREGGIPFYEECGFERHEMTASLEDGEEDLVPMKYEVSATSEES